MSDLISHNTEKKFTLHRRFDRMGRLVGDAGMEKLFHSHVVVIGLGGVGSWAAESLARSGIGHLTLVDFDEICTTNANRQLHALQGLVGQKKSSVMAERLQKINPQARVDSLPVFYSETTASQIFDLGADFVLDAIDNLTAKCHLLSECRRRGVRVITSAGASARFDPLQIRMADLSETSHDPMAHQVRKMLRQDYGFPREGLFGIPCVYSTEEVSVPEELEYDKSEGFRCVCPHGDNGLHSCEKRRVIYGTASFVTGSFGLAMSSHIVRSLLGQKS